jgi:hypothetical protein
MPGGSRPAFAVQPEGGLTASMQGLDGQEIVRRRGVRG